MYTARDERDIAVAMAIDELSAFDVIPHGILIEKLKMYKLHKSTITWLRNYLKSRSQYVSIGGQDSTMRKVDQGVPQ